MARLAPLFAAAFIQMMDDSMTTEADLGAKDLVINQPAEVSISVDVLHFLAPAVCRNFSYVDVNILEIGPLTAAAARLARQVRQLSPQMMGRRPPGEPSSFAGFSSASRSPPAYSCMWEG